MTMSTIDEYIIRNTMNLRLAIAQKKIMTPQSSLQDIIAIEELSWRTMLQAIISQRGWGEIDHIKALLQDSGMMVSLKDCDIWIGYILFELWEELKTIHMEHTKQKEATGGGPAFGMRSFTPTAKPNIRVSAESAHRSSVSGPPPLLGAFDDVDLYV